mgnify:CR=1 FL=1
MPCGHRLALHRHRSADAGGSPAHERRASRLLLPNHHRCHPLTHARTAEPRVVHLHGERSTSRSSSAATPTTRSTATPTSKPCLPPSAWTAPSCSSATAPSSRTPTSAPSSAGPVGGPPRTAARPRRGARTRLPVPSRRPRARPVAARRKLLDLLLTMLVLAHESYAATLAWAFDLVLRAPRRCSPDCATNSPAPPTTATPWRSSRTSAPCARRCSAAALSCPRPAAVCCASRGPSPATRPPLLGPRAHPVRRGRAALHRWRLLHRRGRGGPRCAAPRSRARARGPAARPRRQNLSVASAGGVPVRVRVRSPRT